MGFKYFELHEFKCSCCGRNEITYELVAKLDELRRAYGKPIRVTSGYRCPPHNAAVGGALNSTHTKGAAADITADDLNSLYKLCEAHFKAVGDGRAKGFIHVDLRQDKVRRWTY